MANSTKVSIMHIGFLQAYFSRRSVGGGELHTERLARALIDRGHKVTIFTDRPNESREGIEDLDVREYPTPLKVNPVNEFTLGLRAKRELSKCDVVTLTDSSAWIGVDVPCPTAMIFHIVWHGWIDRQGPIYAVLARKPQAFLYREVEKKICRESDVIVSISRNIRDDIRKIGSFERKIWDIPNGVDIDRFQPTGETYDDFTVCYQGRLVGMKNPELIVEAVALSDEPWQLKIGGDGPLRSELEAMTRTNDLEDRIEFLGFVPETQLPSHYARCDVFVLPSKYEGMPLTVLEAEASGLPIVASPRAATDFVTNEIGCIVEPTAENLSKMLDKMYRHPNRTQRMGERARERAEDYSWESIASKYEKMYDSLCE